MVVNCLTTRGARKGLWLPILPATLAAVLSGCGLGQADPLEALVFCGGQHGRPEAPSPAGWAGWEDVSVIAHRGFACCNPENTLEALDAAIRMGAHAVEVDVRLTRDGWPVLMHDASLSRTTDSDGYVRDYRLAELAGVNACPGRDQSCAVPTLRATLAAAAGRTRVVIDLKTPLDCGQFSRIADPLEELGLTHAVAIISADVQALSVARSFFPAAPLGLYILSEQASVDEVERSTTVAAALGNAEILLRSNAVLDGHSAFQIAVENGIPVVPWTVRDRSDLDRLFSRPGVRRALSDVPSDSSD